MTFEGVSGLKHRRKEECWAGGGAQISRSDGEVVTLS